MNKKPNLKETGACPKCKILMERIKELEKKVKELERRLSKYENAHTPPSEKKFFDPPSDKPYKNPGRPMGYPGTTRPVPIPDEIVEVKSDKCPHCFKKLGEPIKIESKIYEDIPEPQPVVVTEYWIYHYECSHCGKKVVAKHPSIPKEGRFGKNLISKVILLKYSERLPHRKIANLLKRDYGLSISPSSILEITNRACSVLSLEYKKILKALRKRRVVNVDETGIKVNGKQYWIWIFTTKKETLVAIRKSRGEDVIKEVLGENFKGIITCDGWRVYCKFTPNIQRCWAHFIREARFIAGHSKEGIALKEALSRIYQSLTEKNTHSPPEQRERLYRNSIQRLRYWVMKEYKTPLLQKFTKKLQKALKHLFTFVLHPKVEPTNNRAERGLREHVVIRKIIGTLRNEKGTRIYEVITSVLTTWKQKELNLNQQLLYAL